MSTVYLAPLVFTGMLFMLFVTGAWKKSFSTAVSIISMAVFAHLVVVGRIEEGYIILLLCGFIILLRSIMHKKDDVLFRDK